MFLILDFKLSAQEHSTDISAQYAWS